MKSIFTFLTKKLGDSKMHSISRIPIDATQLELEEKTKFISILKDVHKAKDPETVLKIFKHYNGPYIDQCFLELDDIFKILPKIVKKAVCFSDSPKAMTNILNATTKEIREDKGFAFKVIAKRYSINHPNPYKYSFSTPLNSFLEAHPQCEALKSDPVVVKRFIKYIFSIYSPRTRINNSTKAMLEFDVFHLIEKVQDHFSITISLIENGYKKLPQIFSGDFYDGKFKSWKKSNDEYLNLTDPEYRYMPKPILNERMLKHGEVVLALFKQDPNNLRRCHEDGIIATLPCFSTKTNEICSWIKENQPERYEAIFDKWMNIVNRLKRTENLFFKFV